MPLYNGTKEIDQVFIGSKEVQQIYNGTKEIWSNNKIIKLSSGTSWDLKSVYSKYNQLTVNNFFYSEMENATNCTADVYVAYVGDTHYLNIIGYLEKNYDKNTGMFTSKHYLNGDRNITGNVTPVIVTDLNKITYVGTGRNVDVKSKLPNYASLTADNFIFNANSSYGYMFRSSRTQPGNWSVIASHFLYKEYDPSTGIVSAYFYYVADSINWDPDDITSYLDLNIYYVPKAL